MKTNKPRLRQNSPNSVSVIVHYYTDRKLVQCNTKKFGLVQFYTAQYSEFQFREI